MAKNSIETAYCHLQGNLLESLHDNTHWEGRLSSSALSTAVASFALSTLENDADRLRSLQGIHWLCRHMNEDGSWGDTPVSQGNLSTTLLVWSALNRADADNPDAANAVKTTESWLVDRIGGLSPEEVSSALLSHYGADRTFSVPILTMCALSGRLGENPGCWRLVPRLPYELAILPHTLYAGVGLPVVSYALPALIAMGLVRDRLGGGWFSRFAPRRLTIPSVLKKLTRIQPVNGGFLEASPLTGFVMMSLVAAGFVSHPVVARCAEFLRSSQRDDGSWPIDTNLSTWLTTLSVNALAEGLPVAARCGVRKWLLDQQHRQRHPYTHSAPGGWAWTDLPGGVPDADDTSGTLLALRTLGAESGDEVENGIRWLFGLQNRDGGMPTFCRGWGKLPFDRSCPDITAHAIAAFSAWENRLPSPLADEVMAARTKAVAYLRSSQRPDGAWEPLWFGNEFVEGQRNPVYGTSRVLDGLVCIPVEPGVATMSQQGCEYLLSTQNPDGSWGGDRGVPGSIEETSLAVHALCRCGCSDASIQPAVDWLLAHVENSLNPSPIGLYFASLWYYEELYPLIFAVQALRTLRSTHLKRQERNRDY